MRTLCACLLLALASSLHAQSTPEGWRWQLDRPAPNVMGRDAPPGSWQFQEMIPGMHVTSGPGVVLTAPGDGASGRYIVDATIVLFPNSGGEGYGVMFGGDESTWNAFLLDATGRFSVVRRQGAAVDRLVEWTPHEAITRRGAEPVTNQVRVAVEPDSIRFLVNTRPVGALPRSATRTDGHFGLRLGEGINVHVTNVDVTRRLLKRR
jgi:hypothetical protein